MTLLHFSSGKEASKQKPDGLAARWQAAQYCEWHAKIGFNCGMKLVGLLDNQQRRITDQIAILKANHCIGVVVVFPTYNIAGILLMLLILLIIRV